MHLTIPEPDMNFFKNGFPADDPLQRMKTSGMPEERQAVVLRL